MRAIQTRHPVMGYYVRPILYRVNNKKCRSSQFYNKCKFYALSDFENFILNEYIRILTFRSTFKGEGKRHDSLV